LALLILAVAQIAQAADGTLPVQRTLEGNYCVAHNGIGLLDGGPQTFTVNVTGTPVEAYLYWSGRYVGDNSGDNQISAQFNGGATAQYNAAASEVAYAGFDTSYYYTYRSTDISSALPAGGTINVTVDQLNTPEAHGAGLIVISEGPDCAYSQVQLNFGLDGFFWNFVPDAGPDTQVTCVDFPADDVARTLDMQMFVGGVEHEAMRGDRIWYATGSGAKPTDIVATGDLNNLLDGPVPPSKEPPFPLNGGLGEWDDYSNSITVPAGATFACFQIESIDGFLPTNGTSGVWIELLTQLYYEPGLEVLKLTNGNDAKLPNDSDVPVIAPNAPVVWTYLVTNTGQVPFAAADVRVVDSVEGAVTNRIADSVGNNDAIFEPGEVWAYQLTGTARTLGSESGSFIVQGCGAAATGGTLRNTYANGVTATAGDLSASDTSHYCNPLTPGIEVLKLTNGNDAKLPNDADVPVIAPNAQVVWTYLVTNTGAVAFPAAQVTVVDSVEGPVTNRIADTVGDGDASFEPGEVWAYQLTGTARTLSSESGSFIVQGCGNGVTGGVVRNTYANSVTATAGNLSASDTSHYCNPPATATVGNRVWGDIDPNGATPDAIAQGNGLQEDDPREQGIDGVIVELHAADGTLIAEMVTSNGGQYLFTGLQPGDYFLVFINPLDAGVWTVANVGADDTVDSDAAIGVDDPRGPAQRTETFTLEAGEIDLSWDAGLIGLSGAGSAAVGNFVWNDRNRNGIQDGGDEAGVPGVTARLFTAGNELVAETTTNDAGVYNFNGIDPGDYYIEFELPSNFSVSPLNAGSNDEVDSDVDPTTQRTATFNVPVFTTDLRWDVGLFQPTSLSEEDEPLNLRLFLPVVSR
jgi:archaellum component FlaG (FlaF/FlaG flagellin family)